MALKEEVYSTDAILRALAISITQKLQNNIFPGTSIKGCRFKLYNELNGMCMVTGEVKPSPI